MLMVVAIVALLAGLGSGVYVGTFRSILVDKAARAFLATAQYARMLAIEQQQQYRIQLDVQNNGFSLVTTAWNEQTDLTEVTPVRDYYCKPFLMDGNVRFEDVDVTPVETDMATGSEEEDESQQSILFRPNGTAQAAVVQIGDGKKHYSISINPATGRAKILLGKVDEVKVGYTDLDTER
jgi:type II secretory pathway pseudopilin PulG